MTGTSRQFIFRVRVVVRWNSVREYQDAHDMRPVDQVVADEIASNLESVSYVQSVSVNRVESEKGESV